MDTQKEDLPPLYFDLEGFIEKEVERLNKVKPRVRKTVMKDGQTETQTTDSINWKKELEILKKTDINRPAWRENFSADTIKMEDGKIGVLYKAIDKNIPVREIEIELDSAGGNCHYVRVKRVSDSFMYSTEQEMSYTPGESYTLKGAMDVKWVFETDYKIEAEFLE